MINVLKFPVRIFLEKEDELHLTKPSAVDGWKVIHLLKNKVILSHAMDISSI